MTLTLMQGHSGSAKKKYQHWIISTTKPAISIKLATAVGLFFFYMTLTLQTFRCLDHLVWYLAPFKTQSQLMMMMMYIVLYSAVTPYSCSMLSRLVSFEACCQGVRYHSYACVFCLVLLTGFELGSLMSYRIQSLMLYQSSHPVMSPCCVPTFLRSFGA